MVSLDEHVAHEGGELSLTRLTVGMLVQQMTMPWKGLDGSKNSVKSASEEAGGDSMASGLSIVYTAECVGLLHKLGASGRECRPTPKDRVLGRYPSTSLTGAGAGQGVGCGGSVTSALQDIMYFC